MQYVEYNNKRYDVINSRLNLEGLGIEKIEDVIGLENLNLFMLSLRNNRITKISGLENLMGLNSLDLSDNQITEIENLDNLVNLETLRLEHNQISELKGIENLLNLKYIYLSNNPFHNDLEGYELAHNNNLAAEKIDYVRKKIGSKSDHIARRLLKSEESEYLDYKLKMYKIYAPDKKTRLEEKKEFLKDILGLVNNFREDKSLGTSYLLIGIKEINGKYNGHHQNVNFNDIKILKDLIHANLTPELISIDLEEYYISGDEKNPLILKKKRDGYDRNLLLKIQYEPGKVYGFKKDYGNPEIEVPYYTISISFYRDGSYTREIPEEVRQKIRNLLPNHEIPTRLKPSILRCYQAIEKLCNFQFENIPYKDVIHRNKIEKIRILLEKYKEELVEHLDLLVVVNPRKNFGIRFIDGYVFTLNELEITISMRLDFIANVFMRLDGKSLIDQTEIKPFLLKLKIKYWSLSSITYFNTE